MLCCVGLSFVDREGDWEVNTFGTEGSFVISEYTGTGREREKAVQFDF